MSLIIYKILKLQRPYDLNRLKIKKEFGWYYKEKKDIKTSEKQKLYLAKDFNEMQKGLLAEVL